METWTPGSVEKFWKHNEATFAGDTIAPLLASLVRKHVHSPVLDAGAGSGALLATLRAGGMLATGVDIVPRRPEIDKGSLDALPYESSRFKTVFCTDVLEHLPLDVFPAALTELRRVLKAGGKLIVTVPNAEHLEESTVWCPHCNRSFHRWGHVQSFNEYSLRNRLGLAGFEVESVRELPLGLMAKHPLIRHGWPLMVKMGLFGCDNLLAVARG